MKTLRQRGSLLLVSPASNSTEEWNNTIIDPFSTGD